MNNRAVPGTTATIEQERTIQTQLAQTIDAEQRQRQGFRSIIRFSPLWICLLIALVLRIWLTMRTHGVIDGDEAMVGIQAENILRGEHPFPLYFYGQPYMGSLEAYLVAILFKLVGPSVWALRAEPILLSLVVVWLTGKLATALAKAAHLPLRAEQLFMTTAMLFAAVSPVYDTVLELHTLGGYIETFVLMLALLLCAFRLTQRWHEGASSKELVWRWTGIGFIIGLGLWVDPLIASAIVTAAIWIVGHYVAIRARRKTGRNDGRPQGVTLHFHEREDGRPQGAPPHIHPTPVPTMYGRGLARGLRLSMVIGAIAGCICGASPAIYWGMRYKWANVVYLLQLGNQPESVVFQQQFPTRLDVIRGMLWFYGNVMTPRLVGGALPGEDAGSSVLHAVTTFTGVLCIFITLTLAICSLIFRQPSLRQIRYLAWLPLLFAFCTAMLFCTSPVASEALTSSQHDLAGRYATPLMLALPFFFATMITAIAIWLYEGKEFRGKRDVGGRDQLVSDKRCQPNGIIYRFGLARCCRWCRSVLKQAPTWSRGPLQRATTVPGWVMFAMLLLTLALQTASYGMVDPAATFQSPSCPIAPANDDPIIEYLQEEHVQYAWAVPWIGNPITFKTNEGIITADPRPIINFRGVTRINTYLQHVSLAKRPAILTFVLHNDPHPLLLWILDSRHIRYRAAFFPSQPGIDVLVVTRLSRHFSLYESQYLRDVFTNCI